MSENYLYGFQSSTVARYLSSASLSLLIATWRKASLFVAATQIQLFLPAPEVDGLRRNRELRVAAEFPGQVMGKTAVPQANPGRNETLDAAILVDSHFEVSDPCFLALGKLAVRGE